MPDLKISIGNREFDVSCAPGEEDYLLSAAAMLDEQAQSIVSQVGRIPEARMLLMAGLMLADKVTEAGDSVAKLTAEVEALRAQLADAGAGELPQETLAALATLETLTSRIEALGD